MNVNNSQNNNSDNNYKKYEILSKEYCYRDSLIVKEFDIGIVAIALLFTALATIDCFDCNNMYLFFPIFFVGIFVNIVLIISLCKLSKVRGLARKKMEDIEEVIDLKFWKDVKTEMDKGCITKKSVSCAMILSIVIILFIWLIIGFYKILTFSNFI